MNNQKLRVWWIPQIPMKPFYINVASVEEGVKIQNILSDYDKFQFENNVKPDYCNAGGLQIFENNEWVDWYIELEGEYFENPEEYLEFLENK